MKRREFFESTAAGGALLGGAAGMTILSCETPRRKPRQPVRIQENGKYDILLKGGLVIDPVNNINRKMDVAVTGGKIALIEANIPAADARRTLDVSELYVTPGLIDMHEHVFHTFNVLGWVRSIRADDFCFPYGVTTVVDAGTSGAESFEDFKKIIDFSQTRILAFLNITKQGMGRAEEQEPVNFDVDFAVKTAEKYPDIIVGFKTAHYMTSGNFDKAHPPWASVDAMVEAERRTNLPGMYHHEPRPPQGTYPARSFRELVLEKMRPGDIHTHCYGAAYPIMLGDSPPDKVNPDVFKARERGIFFDVGHGSGSCVFRHAVPSIEQGYIADAISTDLYASNTRGPVMSMQHVMSKFLCMGLPLEDVIRRSTVNPARILNRPELGTLNVGARADVAVFDVIDGVFGYDDAGGAIIKGDKTIKNIVTIFGGNVVFDPYGLSKLEWEKMPEDSRYWQNFHNQPF